MNYRHAFHAGNFADVIKHVALVAVLLHLRRKDKPFCVIDTHAGSGIYDLRGDEATRTGEGADGIGRLGELSDAPQLPDALKAYLDCVRQEGKGLYPGSARIAAQLLRPQDRLVAIEKHPDAANALRGSLTNFANVRIVEADGYERLFGLLPPRERRGVILIDPPYEADNEFAHVADVIARAHRCFATGIYLLWYPIKSRGAADAFSGEIAARGIGPLSRLEIDVGRAPVGDRERLSAAGLLIVNAPYGFDAEIGKSANILAPHLGHAGRRPATINFISPPA